MKQVQGEVQQLAADTAEPHEESVAVVETHNHAAAVLVLPGDQSVFAGM